MLAHDLVRPALITPFPLLIAAATVGILHMSAPDHWGTLIALGRIAKWSRTRLLGVGAMTGAGHVALSILLGFAIAGLGFLSSQEVVQYLTVGIGGLMLVGGLVYGAREFLKTSDAGTGETTKKKLRRTQGPFSKRFLYFAGLGAVLSPDLGILPIFLLAIPLGLGFAVDVSLVFGLASIGALMTFVILGTVGLAKAFERLPPKYNDALVGLVVAAVGAYILLSG